LDDFNLLIINFLYLNFGKEAEARRRSMRWMALFRIVVFGWILFTGGIAGAEERDLLRAEDVQKVMGQILSQHVKNKQITADILRSSLKVYIEQFDPDRIYLMESEVKPFLSMTDAQLNEVLAQYGNHDFSTYEKLNTVIQGAITRARANRTIWMSKPSMLMDGNQFKNIDSSLNANSPQFARSIAELQLRQKRDLAYFINAENSRFGKGLLKNKQNQLVKLYDQNLREREASYLFVDAKGLALNAPQQENLQITHIIKALASSLDAHTSFLNSSEAYDLRVRLEKGFDGVGIVLGQDDRGFKVVKILPNSSAEKSGRVDIDDRLLKIDGQTIADNSLNDVTKMLRGKNGSQIALEFSRGDQESHFTVMLNREPITINDGRVETEISPFGDGIIGTIKLHSFYQGNNGISSEKDVREAIKQLKAKGNLRGLILDLRDNSGGFLTQAVKVAGLFITNGVIVISKYSNGEERFYRDMDGKVTYDGPLVVLTSRATASAAEIVSQALQDYGVALIVGDEQTYGKGTIQSQTVTGDEESANYFKVTVGTYYTVSGKTPQIQGVKADIVVPSPYSLTQMGEEYLEYPISQDRIPASFKDGLQDIDPGLRPWYLRYYMPTLQQQTGQWRDYIPQLSRNSQMRLNHNKKYEEYLDSARFDEEQDSEEEAGPSFFGKGDPQMKEAVNVVKDMIVLKSKSMEENSLGITKMHADNSYTEAR